MATGTETEVADSRSARSVDDGNISQNESAVLPSYWRYTASTSMYFCSSVYKMKTPTATMQATSYTLCIYIIYIG